MSYDKNLVAGKLRRWDHYLDQFHLPAWSEIPDIGLYMEQVVVLLKQYLDYLPPELKEEQLITSATINNYVRTKIMPEPKKKRYYRIHLAYLIIICTLKQSLSIAMIRRLIPSGLSEDEVQAIYESYVVRHRVSTEFFAQGVRSAAAVILDHDERPPIAVQETAELIESAAIVSGFARLLAEKLLLLEGCTLENGGSLEIEE